MIKLKLILKGIIKYPTSLGLNLLSLIITFTGVIFLMLYVSYEYSFDKNNVNYNSIYKIVVGKEGVTVPAKISPIIRNNITEIEAITPFWMTSYSVSTENLKKKKITYASSGFYAKNDVFDIFTLPLVYGSKKDALTKPYTVVVSKDLSEKIFGDIDPLGKQILLGSKTFTITAVMENIPKNSSFNADFISSFITISQKPDDAPNTWEEWSYRVFCKLSKNADKNIVRNKIDNIDEFVEHFGLKDKKADGEPLFYLQPLNQLHFSNDYNFEVVNTKVLHILIALIMVLLVMGLVNFINISTAQAFQKIKGLSIMRILGAEKWNIKLQIIYEGIFISLLALFISILLHHLLVNQLQTAFQISGFGFEERWHWYFIFLILAIIFGVISAIYPAFYMSSPQLAQSIKGVQNFTSKGKFIRNSLLVLQFVFAIVLISVSIGINRQLNFWHNYDIGIKKDNVIFLNCSRDVINHNKTFVKELIKTNQIEDYAFSAFSPGYVGMGWGRNVLGKQVNFSCWPVDENFLKFFNIKIVKGRSFSETIGADVNTFIFNEKAIAEFNWEKPLEMSINGFDFEGKIIGVSKDFNFASLKDDIKPMAFWLTSDNNWKKILFLRLKAGNHTQQLEEIKKIWTKFDPIHNIRYFFLDESLNRLYVKEDRIANFIKLVTIWTILLSITGLLGLVVFSSRERTKEIGVRKVNGARVVEIMQMLNYYFLRWLIIAFVLALPLAYYFLDVWLQSFAYRIEISWWIFTIAGAITFFIALFTMSWFTFRVARQNPVKTLRYE